MEFLAHFLREQGRVSEAEAMEASASEIRKGHVAQLSPKRQASAQPQRSVTALPRRRFCTSLSRVTLSRRAPRRPRERWCSSWRSERMASLDVQTA